MAEFAYQNQIGERETVVSLLLASYGANWPCFWGEDAVGDLKTFEDKWESGPVGVCSLLPPAAAAPTAVAEAIWQWGSQTDGSRS